jgi:hypothetical protein
MYFTVARVMIMFMIFMQVFHSRLSTAEQGVSPSHSPCHELEVSLDEALVGMQQNPKENAPRSSPGQFVWLGKNVELAPPQHPPRPEHMWRRTCLSCSLLISLKVRCLFSRTTGILRRASGTRQLLSLRATFHSHPPLGVRPTRPP